MTYTEHDVAGRITAMLDSGQSEGYFTPEQTGLLDQYHAGGVGAVDKLIPSLAISPGDVVIDVGSGFGGPARRIAEQTSATVVGVDITAGYVEAAQTLTMRMGYGDQVRFQHADITALSADHMLELGVERPFDAAITMHVQMNVADKHRWFSAVARLLAPRARLAVWEVCATAGQQPPWPMPWSLDGTDSFLSTPHELEQAIRSAGFTTLAWVDETAWVNDWSAATLGDGAARPELILPMIIEDGMTRVMNFSTALRDGTLTVMRGAFIKAVPSTTATPTQPA
ncbi:class I SAM-dependent methyltransferase [Mycolicibacterium sp. 050158]|uniref:SAM-dependent methyltransferase n=1 Tax=Mycolicibacterium sp. 050158 TaxID=3090602 RepID=UPI00299DE9D9|nr:class I SAM-dependent methyltransferase [Mycolicibacterium sp. 050158]MDX1892672.1 class I SAM-dependent methyltransferase [Mycolicibacterium sp. 050158]